MKAPDGNVDNLPWGGEVGCGTPTAETSRAVHSDICIDVTSATEHLRKCSLNSPHRPHKNVDDPPLWRNDECTDMTPGGPRPATLCDPPRRTASVRDRTFDSAGRPPPRWWQSAPPASRSVAQPGRAAPSYGAGRRFEPCRSVPRPQSPAGPAPPVGPTPPPACRPDAASPPVGRTPY